MTHTSTQTLMHKNVDDQLPDIIPFGMDELNVPDTHHDGIDNEQIKNMHPNIKPPYRIYMSSDPFEDTIEIEIGTRGDHYTLGLFVSNKKDIGNQPQLLDCQKSTPVARILKWRPKLCNSFPISINGTKILSKQDIIRLVKDARTKNKSSIYEFAIIRKIAMHPQMGIPILYHNQLNVIATHMAEIKDNIEEQGKIHCRHLNAILPSITKIKSRKKKAKLTRHILKVQHNWFHWESSERSYNNTRTEGCSQNPWKFRRMQTTFHLFGHMYSKMMVQRKREHPATDPQECKAQPNLEKHMRLAYIKRYQKYSGQYQRRKAI